MTTKEKILNALNIEKKGDWDKAHEIVQVMEHEYAYWVHAYLHRIEGDIANASYWYNKAGRAVSTATFLEEWNMMVEELLSK